MTDYLKTEMLSLSDKEMLIKDMGVFKTAINYGKYIFPLMLIFSTLSWYYDWHSMLKLITTILTFAALFSVAVSFFQVRNIKRDLSENVKKREQFVLEKRFAEGYVNSKISMEHNRKVKRKIKVYPAEIEASIAYQKVKQDNGINFLNQDDTYEQLLKYSYWFALKPVVGGKTKKYSVPIEYYLVGEEGSTIVITSAVHSKKIFRIETN